MCSSDLESPALEGAPQQTTAGRDAAFRFSCDFNRLYGKIVMHFSLRTLSDGVKAERFEQFKTKIREIWPATFLHVVLPLGVIMSRRNRAAGNLLPVIVPQVKRKNPNDPPEPEPVPEDFSLPAEPAPALLHGMSAATEEETESAETVAPEAESAPMERRADTARSAAAIGDLTSAVSSQTRGKRKRRRSKSGGWKKGLRISLYLIVALVVMYFLIILNLQKN